MMDCHALLFCLAQKINPKSKLWICSNTYNDAESIKKMVKINASAVKTSDQNCAANKKSRAADTQGCRRCVYYCHFLVIVDDQTDPVFCH